MWCSVQGILQKTKTKRNDHLWPRVPNNDAYMCPHVIFIGKAYRRVCTWSMQTLHGSSKDLGIVVSEGGLWVTETEDNLKNVS